MTFLRSLRERARALRCRVAFPEGTDPRIAAAAREILTEELLEPVLLGPRDEVRAALESAGVDPDAVTVHDPGAGDDAERLEAWYREARGPRDPSPASVSRAVHDPLSAGALLVRGEVVDGCVAGAAHATPDVIRAAIRCVGTGDELDTVSSAFYMVVDPFRGEGEEVLTFTDGGVVRDPDADTLAEIALAAARARRLVVGDEPVVAFLSYSTHGSADGPSVRRVAGAIERFRERAPGVPADGELQVDAALIDEVGRKKVPGSPVAGRTNVLVFPDLDAGNIGYKLVQRLAGAVALGPILQGLRRPCNDLSRGATAEDVVNVACITALMAKGEPGA